jgi:hypothetical protein
MSETAPDRFGLPGTPIFDGETSRRGLRMNKHRSSTARPAGAACG